MQELMSEKVDSSQMGALSLEKVLIDGDLSSLSPNERMLYYTTLCKSVGLNSLAKPFDYIRLNGKLVLYAKRDCTDQLRKIHNVSIAITSSGVDGDCYQVRARATDKTGRFDEATGSVPIINLKGEARSNAIMKAETKAKRRVTLSICGLGMLDESEVSNVSNVSAPLFQDENIGDTIVVDIISNLLSEIKSYLKDGKLQDAYLRCESLSKDHKNEIWSLLDNKERILLKNYKEGMAGKAEDKEEGE